MEKKTIDSSNISKFLINNKDRRQLRMGNVKDLVEMMRAGIHFSAPFVINEIGAKWALIDGNHRYEAIKAYLAENSRFSITIWMATYRNLNPEEEKEVYSLWNSGATQSATDFLNAYWSEIPMGKEMIRKLPANVYGDKQHLKIQSLMGGQINAKKHTKFEGGYSAGREQIVDDFMNVTNDDVNKVEEFASFMEDCFGAFDKKTNPQFYQTTPLAAFYRIWYDNQSMDSGKVIKTFKKIFAKQPELWTQFTKSGGRSATQTFYRAAIASLKGVNEGFKDDNEAIEIHEREAAIIELVHA